MKHYSITNICIDYDGIRNERYISKSKLKNLKMVSMMRVTENIY